ncbi:hypothetical protein LEN26_007405 [Aphanomyces euteiches]|nr:hypothetical protein LEN26_007405 [Aphanomyces euteiches]
MDVMHAGNVSTAKQLLTRLQLINPDFTDAKIALGAIYQMEGAADKAMQCYRAVLDLEPTNDAAHGNLGVLYFTARDFSRALDHLTTAMTIQPQKVHEFAHMVALAYHDQGNEELAIHYYEKALKRKDEDAQIHFDFAVSLQDSGAIMRANTEYNKAIKLRPDFPEAWLNVATLHLRYGDVSMAITNLKRTLECPSITPQLTLQTTINYGVALESDGQAEAALERFTLAASLARLMTVEKNALEEHALRVRRSIALWQDFELLHDVFIHDTVLHELGAGVASSMVPFTSLLVSMSPQIKRRLAEVHTANLYAPSTAKVPNRPRGSRLHVGYLSFDFNNHPTAHLIEGLFRHHNTSAYEVSALSYGKDDGSPYRQAIPSLVEHFVDLILLSNHEAANAIEAAHVDILIDAQGHTLGQRHAIVAARPAPIIINYLVYPGTLGASYVDYLITDAYATPPEHADHYTEKLIMLPNSYQVNYIEMDYKQAPPWSSKAQSRPFIFANYNKIEKLEPRVFGVWMSILRRAPHSELWLMRPSARSNASFDLIVQNIQAEAAQWGISPSRLRFLPRVSKREHLLRQHEADLFLDTFVYGAHSTATDAIAGNLPVLTLAGDTFASRVGISLLTNCNLKSLVVYSAKEFEDIAVFLATKPWILRRFYNHLRHHVRDEPLFNTAAYTHDIEVAYSMAYDLSRHERRIKYHLVLPHA